MKWNELKLRTQLMTGFLLVALVALIIGVVGYWGTRQVAKSFQEVSDVRLPSVKYLLEMKSGFERLSVAHRTLLNPNLSVEEKSRQFKNIVEAREAYTSALAAFEPLPQTAEEAVLWKDFKVVYNEWTQANEQYERMLDQIEQKDIFYPMEFLKNLNRFESDHHAIQVKVANAVQSGKVFEGGDDHTACNMGHWLKDFSSSNPVVKKALPVMISHHEAFHQAVHDTKDALSRGNQARARSLYLTEMIPSANKVFEQFDIMTREAEITIEVFEQAERWNLENVNQVQARLDQLLAQVVEINNQIATDEAITGDKIVARSSTGIIAILVSGVFFALFLGGLVTRTVMKQLGGEPREIAEVANQIAGGNLNYRFDEKRKFEGAYLSIREMSNRLKEIVTGVHSASDQVAGASIQIPVCRLLERKPRRSQKPLLRPRSPGIEEGEQTS